MHLFLLTRVLNIAVVEKKEAITVGCFIVRIIRRLEVFRSSFGFDRRWME